jgi:cytoplasmic iron level regulating protein YaaA (DUF328/UPF0246 family)
VAAVLLLLPPSEGKATPADGPPVDLDALAFAAELGRTRRRVLTALGGGVRRAPAAPAAEVYTGVLFQHLGLADLPAGARRRAEADVLIASGLWGLVAPQDRIPHYKLPIGEGLPKLGGGLAAAWRAPVAAALAGRDVPGELVVDLRSGGYAAVWRPRHAAHLTVRSLRIAPDGSRTVVSHMAKAARGDVARAVLRSRRAVRTPEDVAAVAAAAGLRVALVEGTPVTLEVHELT